MHNNYYKRKLLHLLWSWYLSVHYSRSYVTQCSETICYVANLIMWFFHFILRIAPSPPSLLSFADVANTSLAITWKGPPDWTDYSDFELQWLPRDALTVFNPYSNRKSEGRIVYGLRPGRAYQFSVKTVSGDSWRTYSKPISGSVRTSTACLASLGFWVGWEDHLTPAGLGLNP